MNRLGWIVVLLIWAAGIGLAAKKPGPKAERYYKLLLKRPGSKTIFERFHDAWLDEGTKDELGEFLVEEAKGGGAPENWVLGVFHRHSGQDQEALAALDRAVANEDGNPDLLMTRARMRARLLNFAEAIEDLDAVIALEEGNEGMEAGKLKGAYLARLGKPEEGLKVWKGLLEAHPDDEELVEDLIDLQLGEGEYEEALTAARKLAEGSRDPYQKALRRVRVGEIQGLHGQRAEAVESYGKVLSSTGQGSWLEREVLARIDELFEKDEDFEGLQAFYRENAKAHPQRLGLRRKLVHLMARSGKVDEAETMMRTLMKLSPGDQALWEELIALLAANDRREAAVEELEDLLKRDSKNADRWEKLAEMRRALDRKEGVRAALEQVDRLSGEEEEGRLRMARLYERFELPEDAERILRALAKGESIEGKQALAAFLMEKGDQEAAMAQWREMARGADLDGLMRVVRALQARGKIPEAYGLMKERREEFGRDPVSLAMFCQMAQMADESEEALPEARQLVSLAKQPTEIHDAVQTATRLIVRAEKEQAVLDQIFGVAVPEVNDLCLAAELQERLGDSRSADRSLERALEVGGGLRALMQRVQLLDHRGEYAKAAETMKQVVDSKEGRRPIYRKRLVTLLRRADLPDAALNEIGRWREATPGDKQAWFAEAAVHSSAGESSKAVTVLRRMIARFGREEEILTKLAEAYEGAEQFAAAREMYERLYEDTEKVTDKTRFAGRLGELAEKEDKLDEIIAKFERRKRGNPKSITPLLALAEIYRVLDRYADQRGALEEATRRRPADIQLRLKLVRVEEDAGDLERAVETLETARKHDRSGAAEKQLARLLLRYGETDQALELLRELEAGGVEARAVERMAEVMAGEAEWEAGAAYLKQHLVQFPTDWRLRYLAGVCAEESGARKEAWDLLVEVARVDAPIDGLRVKPIVMGPQRQAWKKIGSSVLPRRLATLQLSSLYTRHAYAYQYARSRGHGRVMFQLPGDPEEARAMALCHLIRIVQQVSENEKEVLLARAEDAGVPDLDLMLHSSQRSLPYTRVLEEKLEKEPESVPLLLLLVSVNSTYLKDVDSKWLVAARKHLQKEHGSVAIIANNELLTRDDPALRKEALESLPALVAGLQPKVHLDGLAAASNLLMVKEYSPYKLSAEEKERVYSVLIESYRKAEGLELHWTSLEEDLVRFASGLDRHEDVIEILNQVCRKPEDQPGKAFSQYYGSLFSGLRTKTYRSLNVEGNGLMISSYSSFRRPSVRTLHELSETAIVPFPPATLSNVPVMLRTRFSLVTGDRDKRLTAFLDKHANKGLLFQCSQLAPLVGRLKDPAMRLLVLQGAGNEQHLQKVIDEVAADPEAGSDALRFAAASFAREARTRQQAFDLLSRARLSGLDRNLNDHVDNQLLMLGALLKRKEQLGEERLEIARKAGLRVLKSPTRLAVLRQSGSAGVKQFNDALLAVGLELPIAKQRKPKPSTKVAGGFGDQVGRLLKQGNRKAAIRRAAREIVRAQRSLNGRAPTSTVRKVIETVDGLDLMDEVLTAIDPGEKSSIGRLLRYAEVCRFVGKAERAEPALARAAELDPENDKVRAQRFSLLEPEDRLEALKEMPINDETFLVLEQVYQIRSSSSRRDYPKSLETMKALAMMLHNADPDPRESRNLTYVNYFVGNIVTRYSFNNSIRIRRLTTRKPDGQDDSEQTQTWNAAFEDLCQAMLRHPQTAEQGFILLYYTLSGRGKDPESLEKTALEALRTAVTLKRTNLHSSSNRWIYQTATTRSSSGGVSSSQYAPLEYLVWLAGTQAKKELLSDELIEELRTGAPLYGERLKLYRTVLFEEGTPRVEAFEELNRRRTLNRVPYGYADYANGIRILLPFIQADAELVQYLGKKLSALDPNEVATMYGNNILYDVLPRYGLQILKKNGEEAFLTYLDALGVKYLGDRKDWDLVEKALKLGSSSQLQSRAQILSAILVRLIRQGETCLPTVLYVVRNGLDRSGINSLSNYFQEGLYLEPVETADDLEELLERSGFLVGVEEFDPLLTGGQPLDHLKTNQTVLGLLCTHLQNRWKNHADVLGAKLMKAEGKERFGRRLVGSLLLSNEDDNRAVAVAELKAEREKIGTWPAKRQVALARLMSYWYGTKLDATNFPDELKNWRSEIAKAEQLRLRQQAERWIKTGFDGLVVWSAQQELLETMRSLLSRDQELAARLVVSYIQHSGKFAEPDPFGSTFVANAYMHNEWGSSILNDAQRVLGGKGFGISEGVRFLAALKAQPGISELAFDYNLVSAVGGQIRLELQSFDKREEIQILRKLPVNQRVAPYWAQLLPRLMADLPPEMEGEVAAGLACSLLFHTKIPKEEAEAVLGVVGELAKKWPILAEVVRVGAQVSATDPMMEGSQAKARQALASLGRLPGVALIYRYELMSMIWDATSLPRDGEVLGASAELLSSYLNETRAASWQRAHVFGERLAASELEVSSESLVPLIEKLATLRANTVNPVFLQTGQPAMDLLFLRLVLRADPAQAPERLGEVIENFKGQLATMIELIVAGQGELARELMADPLTLIARRPFVFDRKLEEALPSFLKLIAKDSDRYRLEVLISLQNDATAESEPPKESRSERVTRLRQEFVARASKDEAVRLETLGRFALQGDLGKELMVDVQKATSDIIIGHSMILRLNNLGARDPKADLLNRLRGALVVDAVRFQMAEGNVDYALRQMQSLRKAMMQSRTRRSAQTAFDRMMVQVLRGAAQGMEAGAIKDPKTLTALARIVLEAGSDQYHRTKIGTKALGIALILHALAGEGAGYEALLKSLPDSDSMISMRHRLGFLGLFTSSTANINWAQDKYTGERRFLLRAMLMDSETCNREITHMSDLLRLKDSSLISGDDLVAVVDSLPENLPRRAEFLLMKADLLGREAVDKEEAEQSYQVAMEAAKKSPNQATLSQCFAYLARYHANVRGDRKKAQELAKSVKPDLLAAPDRKWYDKEAATWMNAPEN